MSDCFAIHVRNRVAKRAGFLSTIDDLHLVTDRAEARVFATADAAQSCLDGLARRPRHFLCESRHYAAMVVRFDGDKS